MGYGIDPRLHQSSGATVFWECPRGHEESDDTPLQQRAFCVTCGQYYEWDETAQLGPVRHHERVPMQAPLGARP